jgi:hypothetical protein
LILIHEETMRVSDKGHVVPVCCRCPVDDPGVPPVWLATNPDSGSSGDRLVDDILRRHEQFVLGDFGDIDVREH